VLTLEGVELPAIVERENSNPQAFDLDPGSCQTVVVCCLKSDIAKIYVADDGTPLADQAGNFYKSNAKYLPDIGTYFIDDEGGRYRITARRPNPGKPVNKYICEYSGVDEE
jgi:hypothetical protein